MEIGINLWRIELSVNLLPTQEILLGLWAGEYLVQSKNGYRPAKAFHIGLIFISFIVRRYEKAH